MREIKFLAFIKHLNCIADVISIDFSKKEVEVYLPDRDEIRIYSFDDVEILRFTGFEDRNGRPIYEGYIVKWTRISYADCSRKEVEETAEFIGEIKWCDTIWGIYLSNGVGHLLMPYFLETDEFEVIGDKYTNPELLGGSNG